MSKFVPITSERHAAKRWQRYATYDFAVQEAVASVILAELPKALISLPIAFIQQGGDFFPAALLGLQPGKNLFVTPEGQWIGSYIPALLRGYPFRLAVVGEKQQKILCIDEDSGLITEGPAGEAFFNVDGTPAQPVTDMLNYFVRIEENRVLTAQACLILTKHRLIHRWVIPADAASGRKEVKGLFKIDEAALNALPGDALLELRKAGALLLAYCQLLSMQHLPLLGKLAEAHAKIAAPPLPANGEIDLEFLNRSGTLRFGNLA